MRLPLRLALPLFATALVVTAVVTYGMVLLVERTMDVVIRQSGGQLERITGNALRSKSEELKNVATVLGILDGTAEERNKKWDHAPIDVAAIVERETGKVISSMGPELTGKDLTALAANPTGDLAIMRTSEGLLIAGTAPEKNSRRFTIAGKHVDQEFADGLKALLQADIAISATDAAPVSTLAGKPAANDYFPVASVFHTPGGAEVTVRMFMPAKDVHGTRRNAMLFAIGGGAVLLLAAFGFYSYSVVRVTRPIRDLTTAVNRMASGDLEAGLPAGAPDELGTLVRQFNTMAHSLKEAQEKLVHSAKLSSMGQLIAGVSHELNNPLSGLLGHAEHLASRVPDGDPSREKLDTIIREARRMQKSLADLRSFARPSQADRVRVDLNQLADEVAALVRHDAGKARIVCSVRPLDGGCEVHASPDQVRQVILNLALNALQAMPEGGELAIEVVREGGTARITVADTGPGIGRAEQAGIFEPFKTTHSGRMGLGLSISKDIVTNHGGKIIVDSEPGRGAKFTVELPCEVGS